MLSARLPDAIPRIVYNVALKYATSAGTSNKILMGEPIQLLSIAILSLLSSLFGTDEKRNVPPFSFLFFPFLSIFPRHFPRYRRDLKYQSVLRSVSWKGRVRKSFSGNENFFPFLSFREKETEEWKWKFIKQNSAGVPRGGRERRRRRNQSRNLNILFDAMFYVKWCSRNGVDPKSKSQVKKLVYVNRSSIVSTELNPAIHLLPLLLHLKIRGNGGIVKKKKEKGEKASKMKIKFAIKGTRRVEMKYFFRPRDDSFVLCSFPGQGNKVKLEKIGYSIREKRFPTNF